MAKARTERTIKDATIYLEESLREGTSASAIQKLQLAVREIVGVLAPKAKQETAIELKK